MKLSLCELPARWRAIAEHMGSPYCRAADELEAVLAEMPAMIPVGMIDNGEVVEIPNPFRSAALAQQAQPEPYFAGSPCGAQFKFEPDKQLVTQVGACRHEATETRI